MFALLAINALYSSMGKSTVKAPAMTKPTTRQDSEYKQRPENYTAAGDRVIDDVGRVAIRTRGR